MEKRLASGAERVATEPGEFRVRRDGDDKEALTSKTELIEESATQHVVGQQRVCFGKVRGGGVERPCLAEHDVSIFRSAVSLVTDCLRAAKAGPQNSDPRLFRWFRYNGEAAVNLNREDGGRRKFLLVEMACAFQDMS